MFLRTFDGAGCIGHSTQENAAMLLAQQNCIDVVTYPQTHTEQQINAGWYLFRYHVKDSTRMHLVYVREEMSQDGVPTRKIVRSIPDVTYRNDAIYKHIQYFHHEYGVLELEFALEWRHARDSDVEDMFCVHRDPDVMLLWQEEDTPHENASHDIMWAEMILSVWNAKQDNPDNEVWLLCMEQCRTHQLHECVAEILALLVVSERARLWANAVQKHSWFPFGSRMANRLAGVLADVDQDKTHLQQCDVDEWTRRTRLYGEEYVTMALEAV